MLGFIFTSLLLVIAVKSDSDLLDYSPAPWALWLVMAVMLASLGAGFVKRWPSLFWHDSFATSVLLVWLLDWRPQFGADAPMFYLFPLYFSLLTSVVTLALINKCRYFDQDSVDYLRYLEKISRFDIKWLALAVMTSLLVTSHFMLYPLTMTFFIVRHSMIVCLEIIDSET